MKAIKIPFEKKVTKKLSAGFSLLELMISISIFSVVSFAFHGMILNNLKQMGYIEDKNTFLQLDAELKGLFSDPSACPSIFGSSPIPNLGKSKSTSLNSKDGKTKFKANDTYDRVTIKSINIKNIDITPSNKYGHIQVTVTAERQRKGGPMGLDVDDNGYEDKLLTTDLFAEIQGVGSNPYKIVSCLDLQAPVIVQATTGKYPDISTEDVYFPFAKVTFFKKPAPVLITASVNIGGYTSDLWYGVQVRKTLNGKPKSLSFGWPDGTGYKGAATQSSGSFIDTDTDMGVVEYQIWVKKMNKFAPKTGSAIQLNHSRISATQN